MSLSIDAHNAVAAAVLSPDKIGDAGGLNGQATPERAETSSSKPGASPAYTVATSATVGAGASIQIPSGVQDDLTGDGARLMALQVKQALAGHAGSIANPSSQSILSLFRG